MQSSKFDAIIHFQEFLRAPKELLMSFNFMCDGVCACVLGARGGGGFTAFLESFSFNSAPCGAQKWKENDVFHTRLHSPCASKS